MGIIRGFWLVFFLACSLCHIAMADTSILPPGIRALAYKHINAKVPTSFDRSGLESDFSVRERLGSSIIKSISADAKAFYDEIYKINSNLAESIDLGTIDLDPKIDVRADVFALAWGLSDRVMIVGALPLMKAKVSVNGGYTNTGTIGSAAKRLHSMDPNTQMAEAYAQILDGLPSLKGEYVQGVVVNEFKYKPVGNWSASGIGDATIYSQWRFIKGDFYRQGAKLGMDLPTGATDDADNLVDIPFGKGYYGTYVETLHDFNLWDNIFVLTLMGRYEYQWPTSRVYRLAPSVAFPLTAEKEDIRYKPGNYWQVGPDFAVTIAKLVKGTIGYSLRTKAKDTMHGTNPAYDYSILESKTNEVIHKVEASLSLSTVELFMRKQFPLPMKIGTTLSRVVKGVNTERVNQMSLDLETYF